MAYAEWTKHASEESADAEEMDRELKREPLIASYNKKWMEFFVEHELQATVKCCENCRVTGIAVGWYQVDSSAAMTA